MTILMDKILQEIVDHAHEAACLGRNGDLPDPDLVSAKVLTELEVDGDLGFKKTAISCYPLRRRSNSYSAAT
jgi:hypothetical protein